ncbi:DUF7576 family protein [Natronobacterium texcoconense]|uniref:Small CPxCG-related zinc finger protein n=1 Tax=Natronobacterium texcoconense TaxID=1095778 RepID=A0A1H1GVY0_NATTX|nr:hypothetical protein [Natronobacterium texcoconense]SDR17330.1 hypothetical protein SAMN04489842_2642 [Natronobacterium texcoconense]
MSPNTDPSPAEPIQATVSTDTDEREPRLEGVDDPARVVESVPDAISCVTCGATIGPSDYRISWVVEDRDRTLERHYCSEECFPEEKPGSTGNDSRSAPRDWSHCR